MKLGPPQNEEEKELHPAWRALQVGVVAMMLWLLLLRACVYVDSITPYPSMYPTPSAQPHRGRQ